MACGTCLLFWLNRIAFVCSACNSPACLARCTAPTYSVAQLFGFTFAVAGAAIAARVRVGFTRGVYIPGLGSNVCVTQARRSNALVISWAGMRGTVTLAARVGRFHSCCPTARRFPGRDIVIFPRSASSP